MLVLSGCWRSSRVLARSGTSARPCQIKASFACMRMHVRVKSNGQHCRTATFTDFSRTIIPGEPAIESALVSFNGIAVLSRDSHVTCDREPHKPFCNVDVSHLLGAFVGHAVARPCCHRTCTAPGTVAHARSHTIIQQHRHENLPRHVERSTFVSAHYRATHSRPSARCRVVMPLQPRNASTPMALTRAGMCTRHQADVCAALARVGLDLHQALRHLKQQQQRAALLAAQSTRGSTRDGGRWRAGRAQRASCAIPRQRKWTGSCLKLPHRRISRT